MLRTPGVQLGLLALAELLAMALWFSASAVVPQLQLAWSLTASDAAWLTMSVQLGFAVGAMGSAALNLADRFETRFLFAACAVVGAAATAAIPLVSGHIFAAIVLRFVTGAALAGVYPPGMKLVASWFSRGRGFGIGVLVGALTLGSALPHLLAASPLPGATVGGLPPWETVLWSASALALVAAVLAVTVVREGPETRRASAFHWSHALRAWSHRPTRLANIGYLGHMWELYAMWAWVPVLLLQVYAAAGYSAHAAHVAGFATIAVGALGCVVAGRLADRLGRTTITIAALAVSGGCALLAATAVSLLAADTLAIALTALCIVWGVAVVADSAQFSAAVSELTDPRYVGTALTVQTSLGFILTLVTIWGVPRLVAWSGWPLALAVLALGPLAGISSMWRLRRSPAASALADGRG